MSRGFTLIEMLGTTAILVLILFALVGFERSIFTQNNVLQNNLLADQDARQTLRRLVAELRAAVPSDAGAYPIDAATSNSLSFFTDVDGDGKRDQVRYFLNGTTLQRGVIKPVGSPAVYSTTTETISTVVQGLTDPTQVIFTYYNKNYAGTSTPLSLPINLPDVRLVKVSLSIDADPYHPPVAAVYNTQVVIRSLKDNL